MLSAVTWSRKIYQVIETVKRERDCGKLRLCQFLTLFFLRDGTINLMDTLYETALSLATARGDRREVDSAWLKGKNPRKYNWRWIRQTFKRKSELLMIEILQKTRLGRMQLPSMTGANTSDSVCAKILRGKIFKSREHVSVFDGSINEEDVPSKMTFSKMDTGYSSSGILKYELRGKTCYVAPGHSNLNVWSCITQTNTLQASKGRLCLQAFFINIRISTYRSKAEVRYQRCIRRSQASIRLPHHRAIFWGCDSKSSSGSFITRILRLKIWKERWWQVLVSWHQHRALLMNSSLVPANVKVGKAQLTHVSELVWHVLKYAFERSRWKLY